MNMKAIFVVMNTTSALAKIENCTSIKGHGFKSRTGLNFFRPYFLYCSSNVHYCVDRFLIDMINCAINHNRKSEQKVSHLNQTNIHSETKLIISVLYSNASTLHKKAQLIIWLTLLPFVYSRLR